MGGFPGPGRAVLPAVSWWSGRRTSWPGGGGGGGGGPESCTAGRRTFQPLHSGPGENPSAHHKGVVINQKIGITLDSVVDLDSMGSQDPYSDPDPDPGRQKCPTNIEKS